MNLLLDIGNTRVKWAQADGLTLRATGWIVHRDAPHWTEDLPPETPAAVWVANVAGDEPQNALTRHADKAWSVPVQTVTATAAACGVRNAYAQPERLGVDRWLACIGAHHLDKGSVLVVDAGTALTVDFVAADGAHQGGLIVPGVSAMRSAITGDTRVRAEFLEHDLAWLAQDTDPAVALGTLQAAISVMENARQALSPDRAVLTGGAAEQLVTHLSPGWDWEPNLVLEGLARLAAVGENGAVGSGQ